MDYHGFSRNIAHFVQECELFNSTHVLFHNFFVSSHRDFTKITHRGENHCSYAVQLSGLQLYKQFGMYQMPYPLIAGDKT